MRTLLATLMVMLLSSVAAAQQVIDIMDLPPAQPAATDRLPLVPIPPAAVYHSGQAVCKVEGTRSWGSGTLLAKRTMADGPDKGKLVGLVVTCSHLFNGTDTVESNPDVHVYSDHDKLRRSARLCLLDHNNDLAWLLVFVRPDAPVAPIASKTIRGGEGNGWVCAFRRTSQFPTFYKGAVAGYTSASHNGGNSKFTPARKGDTYRSKGDNQLCLDVASLSGDSGGAIFNEDGELLAVLWGGDAKSTYGSYCGTVCDSMVVLPPTARYVAQSCCPPGYGGYGGGGIICPPSGGGYYGGGGVIIQGPMPSQGGVISRPVDTPQQRRPGSGGPPPPVTSPGQPGTGNIPTPGAIAQCTKDHEAIKKALLAMTESMQRLEAGQQEIKQKLSEEGLATAETQQVHSDALAAILQKLSETEAAVGGITAKLDEQEVTIKVESDRFISPSYVDVSVLWALQQKFGYDHMVLVEDSASDRWPRLRDELEMAREAYPAIDFFDVQGKNLRFKDLPQLVLYPLNDGEPEIIHGTDAVSKKLQQLARGD